MNDVITARLSKEINKNLAQISKVEHLDKSTVLRRLLIQSIYEWRLNQAITKYKSGEFSAGQTSKYAGISMWRLFDVLKEKGVHINYDIEEFEKDIKTINKYFK